MFCEHPQPQFPPNKSSISKKKSRSDELFSNAQLFPNSISRIKKKNKRDVISLWLENNESNCIKEPPELFVEFYAEKVPKMKKARKFSCFLIYLLAI